MIYGLEQKARSHLKQVILQRNIIWNENGEQILKFPFFVVLFFGGF